MKNLILVGLLIYLGACQNSNVAESFASSIPSQGQQNKAVSLQWVFPYITQIAQPTADMYLYGVFSEMVPFLPVVDITDENQRIKFADGYPRPAIASVDYIQIAMDQFVGEGNAAVLQNEIDYAVPLSAEQLNAFQQAPQWTTALPSPVQPNGNIYYLLSAFDIAASPLTSRPQGQVGDCYANGTTNYSLISLACSQLGEACQTPLNTLLTTQNQTAIFNAQEALVYGKTLQWSRPALQYGNQKFNDATSGTLGTLSQGGSFYSSVLGAQKFLVPEDLMTQPILYTYNQALTLIQLQPQIRGLPAGVMTSVRPGTTTNQVFSAISASSFANSISQGATTTSILFPSINVLAKQADYNGSENKIVLTATLHDNNPNIIYGQASVSINPKISGSRTLYFKFPSSLKMTATCAGQHNCNLTINSKPAEALIFSVNISQDDTGLSLLTNGATISYSYDYKSINKSIPGLNDMLLEAWAKKTGVGMLDAAAGFDTEGIYQLSAMKINYQSVANGQNAQGALTGDAALSRVRGALKNGCPVMTAVTVYPNYMNSSGGMVASAFGGASEGGHVNVLVGIANINDKGADPLFNYWKQQTKGNVCTSGQSYSTDKCEDTLVFSMNSWGIGDLATAKNGGSGPIGTSPVWAMQQSPTTTTPWIPSNIYWLPGSAFYNGTVNALTFVDWPINNLNNAVGSCFQ